MKRLGLTICEDLWVDDGLQRERLAGPDPIDQLIPEQPDLVINLAASPFDAAKPALRQQLAAAAAQAPQLPTDLSQSSGGQRRAGVRRGQFCGGSRWRRAAGASRL